MPIKLCLGNEGSTVDHHPVDAIMAPAMISAIIVLAITGFGLAGSFAGQNLAHIDDRRTVVVQWLISKYAIPFNAGLAVIGSVALLVKSAMFDTTALVVTGSSGTIVMAADMFSARSLIGARMTGFAGKIFGLGLGLVIDCAAIQREQTDRKYSQTIAKLRK